MLLVHRIYSDSVKTDGTCVTSVSMVKETGSQDEPWLYLTKPRVRRQTFLDTKINIRLKQKREPYR